MSSETPKQLEDSVDLEDIEEVDDGVVLEDIAVGDAGDADTDSQNDESDATEALDELEAEELEMLTEDESNETIVVDEAAEMRAIRRAEIAMEAGDDEFVCTSCFLVKHRSQLAAKRKKICLDCAS